MSAPTENKLLLLLQYICHQCNSLFVWEVLCEFHYVPFFFCEDRKIVENELFPDVHGATQKFVEFKQGTRTGCRMPFCR